MSDLFMEDEPIFRAATYRQALSSLMAWCSRTERSIVDVQRRMEKMQLSEEVSAQVLAQLQAEGFVNNQRFVNAFVHDSFHYNKWGVQKIKQALYNKGIGSKEVDEAFAAIVSTEDQISQLEKELLKKKKSLSKDEPYQVKVKLLRFAASRGYDMDLVYRVISKLMTDENDDRFIAE